MATAERLSLIADLEEAIGSGTRTRRLETLRRVTDLFMNGAPAYSEDQVAVFDDVIGRLAADIEARARLALSNRLANVPNAPINVVKKLAFDDSIDVAGPILEHFERLDPETLVRNLLREMRRIGAIIERDGKLYPTTAYRRPDPRWRRQAGFPAEWDRPVK